jgi:hypothetical protein
MAGQIEHALRVLALGHLLECLALWNQIVLRFESNTADLIYTRQVIDVASST